MVEKVGRYEILDEIGEGGFAIVYRAHDTELDRLRRVIDNQLRLSNMGLLS